MKSFSCYIQDELIYEEVSQEISQSLDELNISKVVSATFRKAVMAPLFKKAVVLWKARIKNNEDPVAAATAVAQLTTKLNPREFVDLLKKLKLIEV